MRRSPSLIAPWLRYKRPVPKQRIEDLSEIQSLFDQASVGYLAMSRDDEPYVVPVSFVYRDGSIYVHSALRGQKLDCIAANPRVCFAVHRLDEVQQASKICDTGIRYHSAIGFGRARLVTEPDLKARCLQWLADKYSSDSPNRHISATDIARVAIIEITLERMTGKRNVARRD